MEKSLRFAEKNKYNFFFASLRNSVFFLSAELSGKKSLQKKNGKICHTPQMITCETLEIYILTLHLIFFLDEYFQKP